MTSLREFYSHVPSYYKDQIPASFLVLFYMILFRKVRDDILYRRLASLIHNFFLRTAATIDFRDSWPHLPRLESVFLAYLPIWNKWKRLLLLLLHYNNCIVSIVLVNTSPLSMAPNDFLPSPVGFICFISYLLNLFNTYSKCRPLIVKYETMIC